VAVMEGARFTRRRNRSARPLTRPGSGRDSASGKGSGVLGPTIRVRGRSPSGLPRTVPSACGGGEARPWATYGMSSTVLRGPLPTGSTTFLVASFRFPAARSRAGTDGIDSSPNRHQRARTNVNGPEGQIQGRSPDEYYPDRRGSRKVRLPGRGVTGSTSLVVENSPFNGDPAPSVSALSSGRVGMSVTRTPAQVQGRSGVPTLASTSSRRGSVRKGSMPGSCTAQANQG
jgi:hypothetical protein